MTDRKSHRLGRRLLDLHVTTDQHKALKQEAERQGYDLPTFLRARLFGKLKGTPMTRPPPADIMLLGDIIGLLIGITGALNKNSSHINQIAKRLDQGNRDVFGLDSCLRVFEQLCGELLKTLNLIDSAIQRRRKMRRKASDH